MFECADPPRPTKSAATGWRITHPRMWEYEAQAWIRRLAPDVPAAAPRRVFVAEDDVGLAGVVGWSEVGGPAEVHIDVLGLALRHRRRDGALARRLMRATLSELEGAAIDAGADELYVEGEVYSDNDASLRLCADVGLTLLETHPTGAQTWSLRVPLSGADVV